MEEKIIEEKLIELVREKPYIFDKSHPYYKDNLRKKNAYEQMDSILELQEGGSEALWKRLRKQHTTYMKKLKQPSGSGTQPTHFRHSETMSFMQQHYRPYKSVTNLDESQTDADDNENDVQDSGTNDEVGLQIEYSGFGDSSQPEVVVDKPSHRVTPDTAKGRATRKRKRSEDDFGQQILKAINETSQPVGDDYDHFGAYIAGRVRFISLKNQRYGIQVKAQLQQIISNFEVKVLDDEEQDDHSSS